MSSVIKKYINKGNPQDLRDIASWRRWRVGYLALSLMLVAVVWGAALAINSSESCEVRSSRDVWGEIRTGNPSSRVDTYCTTAAERGEELNVLAVVGVAVLVSGIGSLGLPRLFRYLHPKSKD